MLIGLTGKAGAGKSTAGEYLATTYGFELRSFAAPLKASAAALLGVTVDDLETWKNNTGFEVVVIAPNGRPRATQSVRSFLQRYGTESHRDVFGQDFWVDLGMRGIYRASLQERNLRVAWTDVRFPNEVKAIRQAGGIIVRIDRHGAGAGDHVSETHDLGPDVVIPNNLRIEDLHDALAEVLDTYAVGAVGP